MGNINKCYADFIVNLIQFDKHVLAQLRVQRGKRLVQQQHPRLVDKGAGNGHPLFLAAGKLIGLFVGVAFKLHQAQVLGNLGLDLAFGSLFKPHGKRHVFKNRKVGKQGVILEHRICLPPVGGQVQHIAAVKRDRPKTGLFKARDNPQQGSFPAARRPQKGKKFPLFNFKAHIIERPKIAKGFGNPFDDHIATFQYITSSLPSGAMLPSRPAAAPAAHIR